GTKKIIVVSEQVKKFYIEDVGIPAKKCEVIYNGINPHPPAASRDEIEKKKQELRIGQGVPVIVNIGRLVPAKANHIFIEALRILDQKDIVFHALIIGEGPLKKPLMDASADLINKKKLTFTGLRKDVPKILDFTDVAVLSSTREGFSMAILESMAKGVPFVATDAGGKRAGDDAGFPS
ncbi:MAG: glycosyltransferase, partial [Candidatus Marinimicrobia bacterium]|nr:glycosyltransferase [Candidatus Neomarinimicrobiota bacterium]